MLFIHKCKFQTWKSIFRGVRWTIRDPRKLVEMLSDRAVRIYFCQKFQDLLRKSLDNMFLDKTVNIQLKKLPKPTGGQLLQHANLLP